MASKSAFATHRVGHPRPGFGNSRQGTLHTEPELRARQQITHGLDSRWHKSMSRRRREGARLPPAPVSPPTENEPRTGYTLGIAWKPFPPGLQSVKLGVTALMVDSKVDWGQKALDAAYEEQRREPDLGPNKCRVIVRTALASLSFQKVGEVERFADGRVIENKAQGTLVTYAPPNETFEKRFSEPDRTVLVDRLLSAAERVRNYLAFCAKMPLSSVGVITGPSFLAPIRMECPPERYAPPGPPESEEQRTTWDGMFHATYERTDRLLKEIPPESPLGRAISLVGEAIWTVDPEERFFYAWRALEVVANFDLSEARRRLHSGDEAYATGYLRRGIPRLLGSSELRLDALLKVQASMETRKPDLSSDKVADYYELRNAIAHGDVSAEQHAAITKATGEITSLALDVVNRWADGLQRPVR